MKFYNKNKKVKTVAFSTEKPSKAGNSISKGYDNFVTRADKEITRAVNDVKNYEKTSPAAFYAITGGLAGAGIGALGNSLLNNDKKKSKVRKLLEGGIAGGILGAGAGAIGGGAVKLEREDAAKKQAIAALNNDLKFKNLTIDALQDGYLDLLDKNEALKKELVDRALKENPDEILGTKPSYPMSKPGDDTEKYKIMKMLSAANQIQEYDNRIAASGNDPRFIESLDKIIMETGKLPPKINLKRK